MFLPSSKKNLVIYTSHHTEHDLINAKPAGCFCEKHWVVAREKQQRRQLLPLFQQNLALRPSQHLKSSYVWKDEDFQCKDSTFHTLLASEILLATSSFVVWCLFNIPGWGQLSHHLKGKFGGNQGYRFPNDFNTAHDYICGSFGTLILGQRWKNLKKKKAVIMLGEEFGSK